MKKTILATLTSLFLFVLGASTNADTYADKTAFESALINVMTVDFEGIAEGPGQIDAVDIEGDEFPGLTLTEGDGASGLFVGIPDNPIQSGGNNNNNFFAADFIPTSPEACLAPDFTGSPVGAVIVDFDSPVGGVGVYFLDVEGGGASIEVFDGPGGTGNSLGILSLGYQGDNSQAFAGIVASGNNISSAVLDMGGGGDGVGIDDLSFGVVEIEVDIDIKPGSDPNPVNPDSKGLIPVAILSSLEFDATTVDPSTVELAGAPVAVRGKNKLMAHEEDVNGDGLADLLVQVETQELDLGDGGTVKLMLTGTTFGGEDIVGYDEVVIVPPEKLPVLVETVTVYANDLDGEDSTADLLDRVDYRIEVSGTWTNKAGGPDAFAVDAEYVSYDGWTNWQDGPDPITEEPGERRNQLDLQVDQNFVDWGEFSSDHTYSIDLPGSGSTVNFRVYDGLLAVGPEPGWYPDNDGSLTITIYRLP